MKWYVKVLKQYADFSGRARRKEYWMFVLFNMIFSIVAILLDNLTGLTIANLPYGYFCFAYLIAVFIPGLAVVVRRLHDTGKSGYMAFINLIPLIGGIWLLVLMFTDGEQGENRYGENPKEAGFIEKNKTTSSPAVFVIIAMVFWLFQCIFQIIMTWEQINYEWFYYIINHLFIIVPLSLLIFIISSLQKCYKDKSFI